MSTSAISGKDGSVSNANGASEIKRWTVSMVVDALDATSMSSGGWREFIAGLQTGSGSFVCIGTRPTTGAATSLTLNTGSTTIVGNAILTSVETETDVEGVVTYTCEFQFTGTPTVG